MIRKSQMPTIPKMKMETTVDKIRLKHKKTNPLVVMGDTMGTPPFKTEKTLVFFRVIIRRMAMGTPNFYLEKKTQLRVRISLLHLFYMYIYNVVRRPFVRHLANEKRACCSALIVSMAFL